MDGAPEQTFFKDPALDRAMAMIMSLAAELYVARTRQRATEVLLVQKGVLSPNELDAYVPDADERVCVAAERDAYVAELMRCVRGEQVSKGAPPDLLHRFG
jgi:hypothetical protein